MWTVKAEAGRLRRVLISNTWYRTALIVPTLDWGAAFRKNVIPEKYREAWEALPASLRRRASSAMSRTPS